MSNSTKDAFDKFIESMKDFDPRKFGIKLEDADSEELYHAEIDEEHRREADLMEEFSEAELKEMSDG